VAGVYYAVHCLHIWYDIINPPLGASLAMRYSIVFDLLLVGAAVALPGAGRKRDYSEGHIGRRQDGPVAPDTASDCSYYDTARTGFSTCAAFQSDWGLTFDQFFDYVSRYATLTYPQSC